jgi:hypothetical protein
MLHLPRAESATEEWALPSIVEWQGGTREAMVGQTLDFRNSRNSLDFVAR